MKPLAAFLALLFLNVSHPAQASELPSVTELLQTSLTLEWDQATSYSVVINASLNEVWSYASNSDNAKHWSVFFDHISVIPTSGQDGGVGSIRRCYRYASEQDVSWDEITFDVKPLESRQIYVYNLIGFRPHFFSKHSHYFVLQKYEKIDDTHTRLTFSTQPEPQSMISKISAWIGKSLTLQLFQANLENIKAAIEQKDHYQRPHPWNPKLLYWE